MNNAFLKISVLFALCWAAHAVNGKGSEFYQRFMTKRAAPAPAGGAAGSTGKQSYVFQSPNGLAHGHGYGGYGYGPWGLNGHGYANLGHIHPVPVTGVKALSVAYDPVSGVPYVCDPKKKADAASGAKPAAGAAGAAGAAAPGAAAGKKSDIKEKDIQEDDAKEIDAKEDDEKEDDAKENDAKEDDAKKDDAKKDDAKKDDAKKDEIKVKIPDYPPCPDPKKSFPWSCLLGDKSSKREECARAKDAVQEASKRYWPAMAGFFPPFYGYPARGYGYGVPVGFIRPPGYGGYYFG